MRAAVRCSLTAVLLCQSAFALRDLSSLSSSSKNYHDEPIFRKSIHISEESDHLRRLKSFLDKIAIDKAVLMTFGDSVSTSDHQQYGVLESWTNGVKRAGISNAFVAAYDETTMEWARQRGIPAFHMPFPNGKERESNVGLANWIGAAKMNTVRDVLSLRFNVLFSDADVLFFENPFPYLEGTFDCETQSDGYGGDNVEWHGSSRTIPDTLIHLHLMPQLNFGLAFVRGTPSMARTFGHLGRIVRDEPIWDQEAYSQAMLLPSTSQFPWRGRHSVRLLEPTVFPTTCQIKNLFGNETSLREMRPVAIHFNCNPPNRKNVMETVWSKYEKKKEYWSEILNTTYDAGKKH